MKTKVAKRRKLSALFGALPAIHPFPGKEAGRKEVGKALGQSHDKEKAPFTPQEGLRQAQELVRSYIPKGQRLADELIADRRKAGS